MAVLDYLKEDYLYEDENDPSYVEQITMADDGKEPLDNAFLIKLVNYLDTLYPQFGTFDDKIYNEVRKYIGAMDNKEVIKIKKRIHKVVTDEKDKFLTKLKRRLGRVRVPKKQ